ncbi:helix-turn-helix domain-containing protein [Clostridium hydrogenum]|uniref:helix-turn-helix domain-containing protein n=1 Tax=Clostridium hydrogenum TaxID=2855764 RepID=UPI001F32E496|nr:helix-turn-helix transcriptional regulator [Clostridium hydrogenum]
MEYIEVLSPGKKLRLLRKKYKLNQEQLSGDKITRNLISEIETGKVKLTKNTAEIILDNLKSLSQKYNFDITETVDYLLESEYSQASKILDSHINELKSLFTYKSENFNEELKNAEAFLIKWDIKEKKIQLYEIVGDYFCSKNDYHRGTLYYEKAFSFMDKLNYTPELLIILKKLSGAYAYINRHSESIECGEFALNHFPSMPKKFAATFLFNNSISLKKLGFFKKAITNFEVIETLLDEDDADKLIEVWNTKGTCFIHLNEYEKARDIFINVFETASKQDNMDTIVISLLNLAECYFNLDDKEKVLESLKIALNNLPTLIRSNSCYLPEVHFQLGNIYKSINDLEKAEMYYLEALKFTKKQNISIMSRDILKNLIDLYLSSDSIDKINDITIEALSLSNSQAKLENDIMYKLINFYSLHNMTDKINELCRFAAKFY